MGVRLYCNVFGTLLPFYLESVLGMGSKEDDKIPFTMALVQLLVYITSVSTSFFSAAFTKDLEERRHCLWEERCV